MNAPPRPPRAQSPYDRPAAEYYAPLAGWRGHSYARRRARILPRLQGRVLDVGCGDGRIALDALGTRGVGLDASAAMLGAARSTAPLAHLVRADAHELPFVDASFDTALVSHSLWLFPAPSQFIHDVRRILRPGGRLIVVSNEPTTSWRARSCSRRSPWRVGATTSPRRCSIAARMSRGRSGAEASRISSPSGSWWRRSRGSAGSTRPRSCDSGYRSSSRRESQDERERHRDPRDREQRT
ncbi:MAG: class I SAM-dependent methyltransferase [Deltaproteobacteria bacterium]|nr:class I SAM-dependent methyltransferase [Deltaproteobacteria bacterium]